jgi:hypothetical protein
VDEGGRIGSVPVRPSGFFVPQPFIDFVPMHAVTVGVRLRDGEDGGALADVSLAASTAETARANSVDSVDSV